MKITFLGTNGWYSDKLGNTPSVLVEAKDCYIIFDAGYGIAMAPDYMKVDRPVYLFISHMHMDHVCGLHVLPKLKNKSGITILSTAQMIRDMKKIISHPYMSPLEEFSDNIIFKPVKIGKNTKPINFVCLPLKHADHTVGFRVEIDGKVVTYCCDTAICENDIKLAKNADVLIHECSYPSGFRNKWGHSNPEDSAEVAKRAHAKKLFLTHFGPGGMYNSKKSRLEAGHIARKTFKNTFVAFDGASVTL